MDTMGVLNIDLDTTRKENEAQLWFPSLTSTCSASLRLSRLRIHRPQLSPPFCRDGYPRCTHHSHHAKKWSPGTAALHSLPETLSEKSVYFFLHRHAAIIEGEEQPKMETEGKHWCEHGRSLPAWLTRVMAGTVRLPKRVEKRPCANLGGPGRKKKGSIYWEEAYWHLCWVLSRSAGFRK